MKSPSGEITVKVFDEKHGYLYNWKGMSKSEFTSKVAIELFFQVFSKHLLILRTDKWIPQRFLDKLLQDQKVHGSLEPKGAFIRSLEYHKRFRQVEISGCSSAFY